MKSETNNFLSSHEELQRDIVASDVFNRVSMSCVHTTISLCAPLSVTCHTELHYSFDLRFQTKVLPSIHKNHPKLHVLCPGHYTYSFSRHKNKSPVSVDLYLFCHHRHTVPYPRVYSGERVQVVQPKSFEEATNLRLPPSSGIAVPPDTP